MPNSGRLVSNLRVMELFSEGHKVESFSIFLIVCLRVLAKHSNKNGWATLHLDRGQADRVKRVG